MTAPLPLALLACGCALLTWVAAPQPTAGPGQDALGPGRVQVAPSAFGPSIFGSSSEPPAAARRSRLAQSEERGDDTARSGAGRDGNRLLEPYRLLAAPLAPPRSLPLDAERREGGGSPAADAPASGSESGSRDPDEERRSLFDRGRSRRPFGTSGFGPEFAADSFGAAAFPADPFAFRPFGLPGAPVLSPLALARPAATAGPSGGLSGATTPRAQAGPPEAPFLAPAFPAPAPPESGLLPDLPSDLRPDLPPAPGSGETPPVAVPEPGPLGLLLAGLGLAWLLLRRRGTPA